MLTGPLELLLAERAKSQWRLRFSAGLEVEYRNDHRRRMRVSRTALLLAIAIGFALAPFQEVSVFHAPSAMRGSLIIFSQTVTPVALVAALLTWFSGPRMWTQGVQSAAVLATFIAVLVLRYFGLTTEFRYPPAMLGITAIAVAIFGAFGWMRMTAIFVLFLGVGVFHEFHFARSEATPILNVYVLVVCFAIAMLGSLVNEFLRRHGWLQRALATALARTDLLTGLSNRADFEHRFRQSVAMAVRDGKALAVLLLDIDHFKRINDAHGHATGDRALRALADSLVQSSAHRPLDIRARTGGEEFVVVWYDVSIEALPKLVDKLIEGVRAIRLELADGQEPLRMTVSVGVCWTRSVDPANATEMVNLADALMYRAKQTGRDRAFLEPFEK